MSKKNLTRIPLVDLKAQYAAIGDEIRNAIHAVLESGQFILGPQVVRFEEEIASYLGCESAIGVASGSDALLLSLMALGIAPGDAVLLPSFTFYSTASCIARLGAIPIFVDINPATFLIDVEALQATVGDRSARHAKSRGGPDTKRLNIRVILPVHLFGQCCPMDSLLAIAKKQDLTIVEDAAQALGSEVELSPGTHKAAGTVGDLGCFSFFPTKTLGGVGDGGLVATNRKDLAKTIRILRVHGQTGKYQHEAIGINSRLDAIQAAVLLVKLRHLKEWCNRRIQHAHSYRELFSAAGLEGEHLVSLPIFSDNGSHVFNYYVIRAQERDRLKQHLEIQGIQTEVYYPSPLHLQPCFQHLGYRKGDLPNSERAASEVLALPIYPELTSHQQESLVQKIKDFYRK